VSTLGKVFFGKESEKASEEKSVRGLVKRNRLRSRVERNQVSSPNPSLSLSL
jgi:hypothetical protein